MWISQCCEAASVSVKQEITQKDYNIKWQEHNKLVAVNPPVKKCFYFASKFLTGFHISGSSWSGHANTHHLPFLPTHSFYSANLRNFNTAPKEVNTCRDLNNLQ